MALSRPLTLSSRSRSSTPALRAAAYMLSSKMSQPVKTRSLSSASGTNSLIFGDRPSVRFPSRMVPICVSEPMGCAMPLRTASTPATNVVATAPMPGIITPNLPFAGSIVGVFDRSSCVEAGFADFFPVAIVWLCPRLNYLDVCKLFMFSHCGGDGKRPQANAENHGLTAVGSIRRQSPITAISSAKDPFTALALP